MLSNTNIHLHDGPLRYVDADDHVGIYRNRHGDEVYLRHGTAARCVDLNDIDLHRTWNTWVQTGDNSRYDSESFREHLRETTLDPDRIEDEIGFCLHCVMPDWHDEMSSVDNGMACEDCFDNNYSTCDDCDGAYESTTTTIHDTQVCESCRCRNWSYCEDCEAYYRDRDSDEHNHEDPDEDCECEAPAQTFSIRNDGMDPLDNDDRTTVTLPAGIISDEGIGTIANYLRNEAYKISLNSPHGDDDRDTMKLRVVANELGLLGEKWQTKDGNFTKRLSRMAYKTHGLKIGPEIMSHVGNIARDHSTAIDFDIEVTRDLNQPAHEFAHDDSCWWQSYHSSRCALKNNGGFGLRTFADSTYGRYCSGRAWVMPLRYIEEAGSFVPTFNTMTPDAFMVFNGYENLEGYAPARLLAHMAGMTYRKVGFTCPPMYINNDSGYLVAPEAIAEPFTDGSVHLGVDEHANLYENEKELSNV